MITKHKQIILQILLILCAVLITAVLVIHLVYEASRDKTHLTVHSPNLGQVKGRTVELENGHKVYEFHNIPYAVPPVGALRFQPAIRCTGNKGAHSCWDGRLDATENTTIKCIQYISAPGDEGTEDCLKLSIRSTNLTSSKPVVVWIHGGGLAYHYGMDPTYSFSSELTDQLGVVTVNINYRLGLLGFNNWNETWNATSKIYANNGIRDQTIALKWVKENIASFGGNPKAVTILGHSGGGTAVLALLSSPLANKLFHRAWAVSPAPEIRFDYLFGQKHLQGLIPWAMGCYQASIPERRQCLLELDAIKFTAKHLLASTSSLGKGYFDFPKRYADPSSEYVGLVYTDPTVITQPFRNLKDAPYTPSATIKVIYSSTAQEVANQPVDERSQVGNRVFSNKTVLEDTLTLLFKNITGSTDIVDKIFTLYPNLAPQMVWDTLVTDLRQTCPNNDVTSLMAQSTNHQIYRVYISNSMENLPISSFHGWDAAALFGFGAYPPGKRDLQFREKLVSMLRDLAYGKVEEGWGTFPGQTLQIGNSDPVAEVKNDVPQKAVCELFTTLNLNLYGNQN